MFVQTVSRHLIRYIDAGGVTSLTLETWLIAMLQAVAIAMDRVVGTETTEQIQTT
jgi:hypothetical protein